MTTGTIIRKKSEILNDVMKAMKDSPEQEALFKELGDRLSSLEDQLLTSSNMLRLACDELKVDPSKLVYAPNGPDGLSRTADEQLRLNYAVRGLESPWIRDEASR